MHKICSHVLIQTTVLLISDRIQSLSVDQVILGIRYAKQMRRSGVKREFSHYLFNPSVVIADLLYNNIFSPNI